MGQLTNLYVSESYQGLIKLANSTTGVTGTLQYTQDGLGNNLPLQISTSSVNITGSFTVNGLPVQADTGSFATTGSNIFKGKQTITGSAGYIEYDGSAVSNSLASIHANNDSPWLEKFYNDSFSTGSSVMSYFAWNDGRFIFHNETTQSIAISTNGWTNDNLLVGDTNTTSNNDFIISGSLHSSDIIGTGSLFLQPNQGDARFVEIYNTSPTDTHITASGGQIFLGDDQTYVKVDNYGSVERIDIVAGNELVVSSSIVNLTGSLHQSGTFYPDVIDWFSSSIVQSTGSYILTTNVSGVTEYDSYQNVASELQQYINTGSLPAGVVSGSAQIVELGFATTGSNTFQGDQTITGSVNITGNISATSASFTYVNTVYETASVIYSSGSNQFGDASNDTQTLWGTVNLPSGPLSVTGSVTATNFTGSLQGTASYATNALSSSYSNNSTSASYANNATSASFSQNTISGSFSNFAVSSSYAQTASFASNGGVTQILAGPNIIVSPLSGQGQVTISSTGTGTGSFNTATGSYGSFYDTTTQVNPVANTPNSMSFNETAITNGVSISGSLSPFNTYIKTKNAGVYNIQFSAQVDKTDGGTDSVDIWIRKNGIDLLDTATTVTLNNNNDASVAAWNWFVQSATNDYYQLIWASADTDMRLLAEASSSVHPGIPSVILTANRIDQFLSNTGSFNGDFNGSFTGSLQGTASFASNALSASYAPGVSIPAGTVSGSQQIVELGFATTGSNIFKGDQTITGSLNVRSGSLSTISNNTTVDINLYLTSSQAGQVNIIKGWSENPNAGGPGAVQANYTGSLRITGSNNIVSMPQLRATGAGGGTDQQGYISGSDNTIAFNGGGIYLNTGSLLFPKTSGNYVGVNGNILMNFTTSSLSGGHPILTNNILYGGSATINSNSGSITALSNNIIVGGTITSTQNFVTNTRPSISNNNIIGVVALNHISSSINYQNNYNNSPLTVNNHLSSSNITNNSLTVSSNAIFGGSSSTGLSIWVSGSQSSNAARNIIDNLIGGKNIIVSSSFVSSSNSNLVSSLIYGQNLIVSGNHAATIGGSTFLGRYNDATSLHLAQDIVFAVGTGTGTATRRTGLYVTSGSLVGVSGSLDVKGNTTMTGSLDVSAGITGSLQGTASYATNALTASFALNGGGGGSTFPFTGSAVITGSLEVIGNTNFTGSINITSSLTNALNISGTMNVQRIQLDTSPFVVGTLSNLGAIRFNDNNTFNISNYDKAIFPTGAYIDLISNTGSNFAEINLYAKYGGVDNDGVKISNYNGSTVTTITTDNTFIAGNTTMTGSLTISGSASPELNVIGNTILTGSVQGNVLPLTVASNTASLNLNNGNFFVLALTGSQDIRIEPSNIKPGQTINIKLNTTGSGTVTFPTSVKQPSGSAYVPTTTVGTDIITMVSFDTTNLFVANVKNLI